MKSSNPVLTRPDTFSRDAWPAPSAGELDAMYAAPARMTIDDVVVRTAMLLAVIAGTGTAAWVLDLSRGPAIAAALAGFVLSLVSGGLLVTSFGLSSIVSVVCGGLGIFYSLRGKRAIGQGRTHKQRGLAQAGFVIGIIATALSVIATVFWGIALGIWIDEGGFDDLERELERRQQLDGQPASSNLIRAGVVAGRVVCGLLC